MKAIALGVICIAIAVTTASADDQYPTGLNCAQLNSWRGNMGECAEQRATDFSRQHPKLVQRTSTGLRITLDDGRKVSIRRECALCLDPIALHAPSRLLLAREQFSEGNTWWLFSLKTGRGVETEGWPLFSPSGRFLFAFNEIEESGYTRPIARIYDITGDDPKLLWRGLTTSRHKDGGWVHKWGPKQPTWQSDEKLTFDVEEWRSSAADGGGFVTTGAYVLRFLDGQWLPSHYVK